MIKFWPIFTLSLLHAGWPLFACQYNVRDVGFVDLEPQPYRLYCWIDARTPAPFVEALTTSAAAAFRDANVILQPVDADKDLAHAGLSYFETSNSPARPAAVLVAPDGRSLSLPMPSLSPDLAVAARTLEETVVTSPMRSRLFEDIVDRFAVVLLIEGTRAESNARAREAALGAIQQLTGLMATLPKIVDKPPRLQTLTPDQAAQEKVFLWSLGLDDSAKDEPAIAVLYGRGRRLGQPMRGTEVTQTKLLNLLSIIGQDCECNLDRAWMQGPLIPARWGSDMQRRVLARAGFDAENPFVKTEISRILARGPNSTTPSFESLTPPAAGSFGYSEVELVEETPLPKANNSRHAPNLLAKPLNSSPAHQAALSVAPPPPQTPPPVMPPSGPHSSGLFLPAVVILGVLVVAVFGTGLWILMRNGR